MLFSTSFSLSSFSLSSFLISTSLLQAHPTFATSIDSSLTPRAAAQSCSGDFSGKAYGVLACADVTFLDSNSVNVVLTVRDTRGDSNDVYGWYHVYGADGRTQVLPRTGKLRNDIGVGNTISHTLRFDYPGGHRIMGVRAFACVDDAGGDTCAPGGRTVAP